MGATDLANLTADEFYGLPDTDPYRHAELIDGEVVVTPPSLLHQRIMSQILFAVMAWTREGSNRGEIAPDPGVEISDRNVWVPDLAWWPSERAAAPDQPPAFEGPPALVVEVLSPSTRAFDATRKTSGYARVGVQELWLVDPEPLSAQIFRRSQDAGEFELVGELDPSGQLETPLLPGLSITLDSLTRR